MEVYRIRRVRRFSGETFLVEDVVLPVELFPDLLDRPDAAHETGTLAQRYGLLLGKAEERITIGVPPPDVAEIFRGCPDKPIAQLDRIVMTLDGRPVEWRIAYWQHMDGGYYFAELK
jgi:GntR family transcriptional regulator